MAGQGPSGAPNWAIILRTVAIGMFPLPLPPPKNVLAHECASACGLVFFLCLCVCRVFRFCSSHTCSTRGYCHLFLLKSLIILRREKQQPIKIPAICVQKPQPIYPPKNPPLKPQGSMRGVFPAWQWLSTYTHTGTWEQSNGYFSLLAGDLVESINRPSWSGNHFASTLGFVMVQKKKM